MSVFTVFSEQQNLSVGPRLSIYNVIADTVEEAKEAVRNCKDFEYEEIILDCVEAAGVADNPVLVYYGKTDVVEYLKDE